MLLNHSFTVNLSIDETWAVFTDLKHVASCFPGAELTESDGEVYQGRMRVKVGPISAQYAGSATFLERDAISHRAVISASGRDSRGQGTAAATITAQLVEEGERTVVDMETDLAITGKVAQFGRGVLGDVSEQFLAIFLERLEDSLRDGGLDQPTELGHLPSIERAETTAREELNLNYVVFLPIVKRALPTVVAVILTAVVVRFMGRRQYK
jgi:carbon monoxide dehydrogenase subunit G